MSEVDQIVSKTMDTYRRLYAIFSIGAIVYMLMNASFPMAFMTACGCWAGFYIGVFMIAHTLPYFIPRHLLLEEGRAAMIRDINAKLESGELNENSDELHDLMAKAGLQPLSRIVEYGPVIGRWQDTNLYEYVFAMVGKDGPKMKYMYIGAASYQDEENQVLDTPHEDRLYLVLDGSMYEHTPEPKIESVQA